MQTQNILNACVGIRSPWTFAYKGTYVLTSFIITFASIVALNDITRPDSKIQQCKDDTLRNNALRASKGFQIASQIYTILTIVMLIIIDYAYYSYFKKYPTTNYESLFNFSVKINKIAFIFVLIAAITLFILFMIAKISNEKCKIQ